MNSEGKIYLLDPGNKRLMPMTATYYLSEDDLQRYLADNADLLPGDQIDPEAPRRWLLVAREMGVPGAEGESGRWSLDHLFLDQDGTPTFVECKRALDTRTRREVVAQMLDYAANGLEYWAVDRLRQAAAETARQRNTTLDDLVLKLLDYEPATPPDILPNILPTGQTNDAIDNGTATAGTATAGTATAGAATAGTATADLDVAPSTLGTEQPGSGLPNLEPGAQATIKAFWAQVESRLREGRVRLLFVVDEAPRELRRLVEFLNDKMPDVEVLIVEVKQYQGEGQIVLAPRVLGINEATRKNQTVAPGTGKVNLTPQTFLAGATPAQQQVAEFVWQQAKQRSYPLNWGQTACVVRAVHPITRRQRSFLYCYPERTDFYFGYLELPAAAALALRQELVGTGLFTPTGKATLIGANVTEQNRAEVCAAIALAFQRVGALLAESKPASS